MKLFRRPPSGRGLTLLLITISLSLCSLGIHSQDDAEATSFLPETIVEGSRAQLAKPNIDVLDSPELSAPEFLQELKGLDQTTSIDIDLLNLKASRLENQFYKLSELVNRGLATNLQKRAAQLDWQNAQDRLFAEREYHKLVSEFKQSVYQLVSLRRPLGNDPEPESCYYFRIPGLSLRMGEQDYFTAQLPVSSKIALANHNYSASRLLQSSKVPHHGALKGFFESRRNSLLQVSSLRNSELDNSNYHLSTIHHTTRSSEQRLRSHLREQNRLAVFGRNAAMIENGLFGEHRIYQGSSYGYWLLGDGVAVATDSSAVSDSGLALAKKRADSTYGQTLKRTEWNKANLHYRKVSRLVSKGIANQAELRKTKLASDLAQLQWQQSMAEQKVAQLEYLQLANAFSGQTDQIPLPNEAKAHTWLNWLRSQEAVSSIEALRFLELAEESYKATAERRIGKRKVNFQHYSTSLYQSIPSVRAAELEKQNWAMTRASASHVKAWEDDNFILLKLRQWAQRVAKSNSERENLNPMKMEAVIDVGKEVIKGRIQVAKLDWQAKQKQYQYDLEYYQQLFQVQKSGAANAVEVQKAYHRSQISQGAAIVAKNQIDSLQQFATFNETLFRTGCISYSTDNGLKIGHFTTEAIAELTTLTVLNEGIDNGRVMQMQSELAILDLRLAGLNRLASSGQAIPVELEVVRVKKKQIENQLSVEYGKKTTLKEAINLVQSLPTKATQNLFDQAQL